MACRKWENLPHSQSLSNVSLPPTIRLSENESAEAFESVFRKGAKSFLSCKSLPKQLAKPPPVTALAWSICDVISTETMASCNADVRCEVASLTKIMTCYLCIRLVRSSPGLSFSTIIQVSRLASTMPGTSAGLREGDQLTIWDLLHGLMLPSGNDAAWCLAENFGKYIYAVSGGTEETQEFAKFFITGMNVVARDLGLTKTVFDNPHGLPNPRNRSCARDLGRLVSICLRDPHFRRIVQTQSYQKSLATRPVRWFNTNKLLQYGWEGVKTGYTKAAGSCLCACYRVEDMSLVITLLNSANPAARWREAIKLLNWALSHMRNPAN